MASKLEALLVSHGFNQDTLALLIMTSVWSIKKPIFLPCCEDFDALAAEDSSMITTPRCKQA